MVTVLLPVMKLWDLRNVGHSFKSWAKDSLGVDRYNSYHFIESHIWQEKTYNTKDKALMNYKVTITNKLIKTKHLHYWEFAHEQKLSISTYHRRVQTCLVHGITQWENGTAVQLDKKLSQSSKSTSTLPYPHLLAINPYDKPAESSHPPKSYPMKIKFNPTLRNTALILQQISQVTEFTKF